jgi:Flp pilus assembly protein TadD
MSDRMRMNKRFSADCAHRILGVVVALLALAGFLGCATSQLGEREDATRGSLLRGDDVDRDSASPGHGARAALVANHRTNQAPSPTELIDVGDRERAAGDYDRAHLAYVRAHFSDQKELAPLERIAYLALRSNSVEAEKLFQELLEESPDDPSLLVGLAYSELAQGESSRARASLHRALVVDPSSPAANAALAVTHDALQDFGRASESNTRAMATSGASVQMLNNQGVSSLLAGRQSEAIRLLRRAGRIDPNSRLAANNLGLALGLARRDQEAYEAFRQHGTRGDALNNLGFICYLRGDWDEARTHFEAALLSSETDELRVLRNLERLDASLAKH